MSHKSNKKINIILTYYDTGYKGLSKTALRDVVKQLLACWFPQITVVDKNVLTTRFIT